MTYDPELNRVYIVTARHSDRPEIRQSGGGDNLFVASIVALDAKTGAYVWHYQTNPATPGITMPSRILSLPLS